MSDTIVLCFILLLASLAPATINPTMVRQELQVAVARVTVVRPDDIITHPGRQPRPAAAPGASRRCCCWRCYLHHLLLPLFCFFLCRERGEKKKRNPQNKSHQIGREKGNKIVHVRRWNKDFKILSSAGLPVVKV